MKTTREAAPSPWRAARILGTIVLMTVALAFTHAPPAEAQIEEGPVGTSLAAKIIAIHSSATVTGSMWEPGTVTVYFDRLDYGTHVASAVVDRSGSFSARFEVPLVSPGQYNVIGCRDITISNDCSEVVRTILTIPEPVQTSTPIPEPTVAQPTETLARTRYHR